MGSLGFRISLAVILRAAEAARRPRRGRRGRRGRRARRASPPMIMMIAILLKSMVCALTSSSRLFHWVRAAPLPLRPRPRLWGRYAGKSENLGRKMMRTCYGIPTTQDMILDQEICGLRKYVLTTNMWFSATLTSAALGTLCREIREPGEEDDEDLLGNSINPRYDIGSGNMWFTEICGYYKYVVYCYSHQHKRRFLGNVRC